MANKMAEGLDAVGNFTYENILSSVKTIVDAMGKQAAIFKEEKTDNGGGLIAIGFKKSAFGKWMSGGLFNAIANDFDLAAGIEITPKGDKQEVELAIINAATIQQKVMFIPVTPKNVQGLSQYREFADNFTLALKSLDSSAIVTKKQA